MKKEICRVAFWIVLHLGFLGLSRLAYQEFLPGVPDAGPVSVAKLYGFLIFGPEIFSDGVYFFVLSICAAAYFCPPLAASVVASLRLRPWQGVGLCALIIANASISIWRDRMIHFLVDNYSRSGAFQISAESTLPIVLTVASGFLIGHAALWLRHWDRSAARRR